MPTVILLDVSLSMAVPVSSGQNEYQKLHLAVQGLCQLLDYLNTSAKMESTALMIFSSKPQVLTTFSREFTAMKKVLMNVEFHDKTCIESGLAGACELVLGTWKDKLYTQVILVTDGDAGLGAGSLHQSLSQPGKATDFPLPFPFPSHLHIVALTNPSEPVFHRSRPLYDELISVNGGGGKLWVPDDDLSFMSVQQLFSELAQQFYAPFTCELRCGSLSSYITLTPRPEPVKTKMADNTNHEWKISDVVKTVGMRNVGDFSIPVVVDRFLVTPLSEKEYRELKGGRKLNEVGKKNSASAVDEGKEASACVLFHGALKLGKMVALCMLNVDWFGMLFSHTDASKKKSCLMLAPFKPGVHSVAWLGPLSHLGVMPSLDVSLSSELPKLPVLPNPVQKRSYNDPDTVLSWIQSNGLQADIQKILRAAKRLPDKEALFYKELNKLRRNALGIGQEELLEGVAGLLDKERSNLAVTADPTTSIHLLHAATSLREAMRKSYMQNIMPYSFDG